MSSDSQYSLVKIIGTWATVSLPMPAPSLPMMLVFLSWAGVISLKSLNSRLAIIFKLGGPITIGWGGLVKTVPLVSVMMFCEPI